jgi:hypothetical protein
MKVLLGMRYFFWFMHIIGQEPAAEIHIVYGRIEQFNGVELRRIGMREHFADEDARNACGGWVCAWRTAGCACSDANWISRFQDSRAAEWIDYHQRKAFAVGGGIPFVGVTEIEDRFAQRRRSR